MPGEMAVRSRNILTVFAHRQEPAEPRYCSFERTGVIRRLVILFALDDMRPSIVENPKAVARRHGRDVGRAKARLGASDSYIQSSSQISLKEVGGLASRQATAEPGL